VFHPGDAVPVALSGTTVGTVAVADVLGLKSTTFASS
jgi:hypothetical protein